MSDLEKSKDFNKMIIMQPTRTGKSVKIEDSLELTDSETEESIPDTLILKEK